MFLKHDRFVFIEKYGLSELTKSYNFHITIHRFYNTLTANTPSLAFSSSMTDCGTS